MIKLYTGSCLPYFTAKRYSAMYTRKITVIGAGAVGSATAFALAIKNIASEIVMVDINEEKAKGEALDIRQATPLMSKPVDIYAGVGRKPGQTRLDLVNTNVEILKNIAPQITAVCPNATYVIVANPVDILTYVFCKITNIPEERVIGSGTLLDTARLRARIAEYLNVSQKNVHAYVFGEHGDTSFIPWSIAEISTININDYKNMIKLRNGFMVDLNYAEIDKFMRSSGAKIIARKGCTNYAIAFSVCSICESLFGSLNAVATVSTMLHGEYGLEDVCLSLPVLLAEGEVQGRILPALTDNEYAKLQHSAKSLKAVLAQLNI